jgi:hypothetical protein
MGKDVFASSIDALSSAISFDPFKGYQVTQPSVLPEERAPIVQTVLIPAGSGGGTYQVTPTTEPEAGAAGSGAWGGGWVGGELSIVTSGVDEVGDIELSLVGNCPRCGLFFGEGTSISDVFTTGISGTHGATASDVEAVARLALGEAGGTMKGKKWGTILGSAITRWKKRGGKPGGLHQVITGGQPYGAQGGGRPYGTKFREKQAHKMPKFRQKAEAYLRGEEEIGDPTKGKGTHFYDVKAFRQSERGKQMAMPPFARPKKEGGLVNIMNIPRGKEDWMRIYSKAGPGVQRAEDADKIDRLVTDKFQRMQGIKKHQKYQAEQTQEASRYGGFESRSEGMEPWEQMRWETEG